jgi:hypothetical protein
MMNPPERVKEALACLMTLVGQDDTSWMGIKKIIANPNMFV